MSGWAWHVDVIVGIGVAAVFIWVRFFSGNFFSRHPFVRQIFMLLVVCFCFNAVRLELRAGREYRRVQEWPLTDAVVNAASVYETSFSWSSHRDRYCPRLEYSYSVAEHRFTSSNQVFDFPCRPDVHEFVDRHGPGTSIRIAYDPASPMISIIPASVTDPGYPWLDLLGGAFFSLVLLADLFSTRKAATASSFAQ